MTIEQLQYFYTINELGTFSKAADEMNITQSALSKQIMKLEQELDVSLFNRSHRQVTLTPAGFALLNDVKILLHNYQTMIDHLHQIQKDDSLTLKIAMLPIFSQYNLSHKIKNFKDKYPDVHLDIQEIEERDLSHHIINHDYDIYVLRGEYNDLSSYRNILLYEDTLAAVISKDNPLSHQPTVSLQQLSTQKLLFMPQYTAIAKIAFNACQSAGFKPKIYKYGRLETILSSANENDGIALVMKKSLHIFHLSHVHIVPIEEDIHGDIKLYYTNDRVHQNVIQQFVSFMQPIKH